MPVALTALDQNRDRVAEELGTHTGLSDFGNSLLDIDDVSTVLDVAAGRGDFLATAAARYPTAKLTGIEPDKLLAAATRLRLALVGRDVEVVNTPVPEADLQFARYDIVFCDPPLSSAAPWAPERVAALPFGPPPLNQHSLGWIEYVTPLISKRGVGVVVTGSDVLGEFANGEDSVRRALITSSAVSAIMSLPRGLRTSSTAPLAMWILEAPDDDRASYIRDSVLMLDARESAATELLGDGFAKMYRQFTEREDEKYGPDYSPGESGDRSDTVARADLASPGVVIEPPYWIAPHRGTETWRSDPLDQYYNDLGLATGMADAPLVLEQTKVHARIAPRVVTIGELVDAGLLTVLRGSATAKDEDFVWWSHETRVVTSKVLFSRRTYNARGAEFRRGPIATEEGVTPIGDRDVVLGRANTGFLAVPYASSGTWVLGRGMQALHVSEALDPRYVAESICSQWNDRHEALYDASARSDIRRYEVALLPLEEQTRSMDRLYELRQTHNRLQSLVSWLESADGELRDALTRGNLIAGETTQMLRLTKPRRPKQSSAKSSSEPKEKS
ncbi:N-6 DNA methylase [Microbacterium sp. 2FI]|uniref:N-6 DNA methylase n=1 Tax=Microbacterium sp. 2FI TaxID=2502193 RepID=UPI001485546B|nr:N-6 DNA methylase [Microbacterium sp. 2FI]